MLTIFKTILTQKPLFSPQNSFYANIFFLILFLRLFSPIKPVVLCDEVLWKQQSAAIQVPLIQRTKFHCLAFWWCVFTSWLFSGNASAYKTVSWNHSATLAVTRYPACLCLKQTLKLSCLTSHLSPLYTCCLLNHTISVFQFRCVRDLWGWNHPNLHSSSFEDEDEARCCSQQINTRTHKLFQAAPHALIWFLYPWTRLVAGGNVQAT